MSEEDELICAFARRSFGLAAATVLALLVCVLLMASWGAAQEAAGDLGAIARKTIDTVIRPGYARLAAASDGLSEALTAYCAAPSPTGRKTVEGAFAATVTAWGRVEHLRFGPMMDDHRHDRMAFWPDPKGIGSRQLAAELKEQDKEALDPAALAGKSVAMQGLSALESLLYGNGSETLSAETAAGKFRCGFAKAIAANVAGIAQAVNAAWAGDDGFARAMLEPGPDQPLYRTPKEVVQELHKAFATGLEQLKDAKLARTLGDSFDRARAQPAPFWRSGLALPFLAANADGLRIQFADGGFAELLGAAAPGLDQSVLFDLNHVTSTFASFQQPILEVLQEKEGWAELHALLPGLQTIRTSGVNGVAAAAGLTLGFNALDGD